MDESEQSKSEAPTPFKLMHARQKGTVARGMDLGYLTSLAAFLGFAWTAGPRFNGAFSQAARGAFLNGAALAEGNAALLSTAALLFSSIVGPVLLLGGTIFLVVLLFEIVQTGFVFSAEPLKPDFNRLNPARGLKRLFSLRLLIETGKQILKLCAYGTVGYLVLRGVLQSDIGLVTDGRGLAALMARAGLRLLAAFVLVAVIFAALDQLIVRRDFLKKMRMSRRELRRELRDREGDPRLKQKRKQLHGELAKLSQSLRNLRKADVLITNPQHLAVALRYDPRAMEAPTVVSTGTNQVAQRLKRLAFVYGIPIIENRALARELHRAAALNKMIPQRFFQPVADIYNAIRQKREERDVGRHV